MILFDSWLNYLKACIHGEHNKVFHRLPSSFSAPGCGYPLWSGLQQSVVPSDQAMGLISVSTDEPLSPKARHFHDSLPTNVLLFSPVGPVMQLLRPFVFWLSPSSVPWGGEYSCGPEIMSWVRPRAHLTCVLLPLVALGAFVPQCLPPKLLSAVHTASAEGRAKPRCPTA